MANNSYHQAHRHTDTEHIKEQIIELETKRDNYIKKTEKSIQKLKSLLEKTQKAKYRKGDAVYSKERGNVVVTDIGLNHKNILVYRCAGTQGFNNHYEPDLLPINLATEALFRNEK